MKLFHRKLICLTRCRSVVYALAGGPHCICPFDRNVPVPTQRSIIRAQHTPRAEALDFYRYQWDLMWETHSFNVLINDGLLAWYASSSPTASYPPKYPVSDPTNTLRSRIRSVLIPRCPEDCNNKRLFSWYEYLKDATFKNSNQQTSISM